MNHDDHVVKAKIASLIHASYFKKLPEGGEYRIGRGIYRWTEEQMIEAFFNKNYYGIPSSNDGVILLKRRKV